MNKPEIEIGGKTYRLRMALDAIEQIEEEFGGLKEFGNIKNQTKALKRMFVILANCQIDFEGRTDFVDESLLKHAGIGMLEKLKDAVIAAREESMRMETVGGLADDETRDGYAAEMAQRKN